MANLSKSIRHIVITYLLTGAFCVAIGLVLWLLSDAEFSTAVFVSCCIGFGICTASLFLQDKLAARMPDRIAWLFGIGIGLFIGLVIAGAGVAGDAFYFLTEELGTLVLGVFFGGLGLMIFTSRTREAHLNLHLAEAAARENARAKQLAETQLRLLQAQIEPHFLFNTLANAISMVRTEPAAAEQTLENLTTLLRHSLQRTRQRAITLAEEVSILRAYLEIQSIRMGPRLTYDFDIPDNLLTLQMPPLLIQPLVENAVLHGLDNESGGWLRIRVRQHKQVLLIEVADSGAGIDPNRQINGTGLTNIRARLGALFNADASLRIMENKPHGVVATLVIPLRYLSPLEEVIA